MNNNITRTFYGDQRTEYEVNYLPDVVYAHRKSGDLKLQLLSPVRIEGEKPQGERLKSEFLSTLVQGEVFAHRPADHRVFPLIVDVPGSGWTGAEGYNHVPRMVELCKRGFVVASIGYRGTFKDDVTFPAAVQDTKEAIRYLRANAEKYHIDPDHVTLLGDSSGGHTVAMAALTGDEEKFNIGENLDQTTAVNACVIFYGPNDLKNLISDRLAENKNLRPVEMKLPYPMEMWEIFRDRFLDDVEGSMAEASPIEYISKDKKMPPFLFINGEDDPIIPLQQGIRFCEKVRECGGRAEFIKVAGAMHGVGCWTREVMAEIGKFLSLYN